MTLPPKVTETVVNAATRAPLTNLLLVLVISVMVFNLYLDHLRAQERDRDMREFMAYCIGKIKTPLSRNPHL